MSVASHRQYHNKWLIGCIPIHQSCLTKWVNELSHTLQGNDCTVLVQQQIVDELIKLYSTVQCIKEVLDQS